MRLSGRADNRDRAAEIKVVVTALASDDCRRNRTTSREQEGCQAAAMESLHAFQLDPCAGAARASLTGCVLRTGRDRQNLITGPRLDLADLCGYNRVAAF